MKKDLFFCIQSLNSNLIYFVALINQVLVESKHINRIKPVHKIVSDNGGFNSFQMKMLKKSTIHYYFCMRRKKLKEKKNHHGKLMKTNKSSSFMYFSLAFNSSI